ncbi:MAG: helix-turn-helix transcriptional regulator [bacterium]
MKVADNPVSRNLASLLKHGESYQRGSEFKKNLEFIEKEIGLNQGSIRNWISGNRNAQFESLEKIAHLFGANVYDLYIDRDKWLDLENVTPEQREIIEDVLKIKDHVILGLIKGSLKIGLSQQEKQEHMLASGSRNKVSDTAQDNHLLPVPSLSANLADNPNPNDREND